MPPQLKEATVSSIMNEQGIEWDKDIIADIFEERDRKLILNIPLGESETKDKLFWSGEENGKYSVKSWLL